MTASNVMETDINQRKMANSRSDKVYVVYSRLRPCQKQCAFESSQSNDTWKPDLTSASSTQPNSTPIRFSASQSNRGRSVDQPFGQEMHAGYKRAVAGGNYCRTRRPARHLSTGQSHTWQSLVGLVRRRSHGPDRTSVTILREPFQIVYFNIAGIFPSSHLLDSILLVRR